MPRKLIYKDFISRKDLQSNPEDLFVFGDNFARRGLGGQAKEMRGEPNAVGIPTKRMPDMEKSSFLYDSDIDEWIEHVRPDFQRLIAHQSSGGSIIWPRAGIATGLSKLYETSPLIFKSVVRMERYLNGAFYSLQDLKNDVY